MISIVHSALSMMKFTHMDNNIPTRKRIKPNMIK